jgi:hypothetical protein
MQGECVCDMEDRRQVALWEHRRSCQARGSNAFSGSRLLNFRASISSFRTSRLEVMPVAAVLFFFLERNTTLLYEIPPNILIPESGASFQNTSVSGLTHILARNNCPAVSYHKKVAVARVAAAIISWYETAGNILENHHAQRSPARC